jgi:hypothetical protein
MQGFSMTRHARRRSQQRAIGAKELRIVLAHGDVEIPAGANCHFLRLSHTAATSLLKDGEFAVQDVDRAKRLMVLISGAAQVITAFKCDSERRFRGARRG